MNRKLEKIQNFDPSGVGVENGNFIGLPFDESDSSVVILPVPWDATVSFKSGTSTAADNILAASYQLDLYDEFIPDAWKMGIYLRKPNKSWAELNHKTRQKAKICIDILESGSPDDRRSELIKLTAEVNELCAQMNDWVYEKAKSLLKKDKLVGILGGDHSTPLGFIKLLSEKYNGFSILQIDAHLDLRNAYEGFEYSHASIFYNALKYASIDKIVHVGIRDYCEEELNYATKNSSRIKIFTNQKIRFSLFNGLTYAAICAKIVDELSEQVYISFDIDGLKPHLCPNTGTPVPGGLEFDEALFLLQQVVLSGRKIIGFDLCEVAGMRNEWDGNVGARLLYLLCNMMGKSQLKI